MQNLIKKINLIFFILLPFIDVITALITRYNLFSISIGVIIKAIYSLILFIYILFFSKSKYRKSFFNYLICIVVFCLVYVITKPYIWDIKLLFNELINLYKYFFTGYLFFSFLVLHDDLKYDNKFYKNMMFYTLIVYSLLMIIPLITQTGFKTYPTKSNLGTIGWFYSANEVSAIFIMLFPFFFFKLREIDSKNKYFFFTLLLIIIPAIFMIGTKVSWYGLIIEVGFITLLTFIKNKKDKFLYFSMLFAFVAMCLLSFVSPTNNNVNKKIDDVKKANIIKKIDNNKITNSAANKSEVIKNNIVKSEDRKCGKLHKLNEVIKNKTLYRIINISLSGRQNKAYTLLMIYSDSNIIDKFFGIGFTNNNKINNCYVEKYIEMDPIDVFVHYGVFGLIIVFIPFIYLIKEINILNIKNYSLEKLVSLLTLGLLLLLSLLSGHIIGYPACSIYLVILMILLLNSSYKRIGNNI